MMLNVKKIQTVLSAAFVCLMIFSTGSQASHAESKSIEAALKKQWDKPNHPLRVPVIVVRGHHAIADWVQEPCGGRALLKGGENEWQILLYGDVNLTKESHLMQAELNLSKEDKGLVNSFKGIVDLLKAPQHHAH
ncbi:MAG: hypothetical protein ACI8PW_001392 [Methylophilaceae bacterium]|jgi:hypothetical protein